MMAGSGGGGVLSASDKLMTAASSGNTELVLQLLANGSSSASLEHDEVDSVAHWYRRTSAVRVRELCKNG